MKRALVLAALVGVAGVFAWWLREDDRERSGRSTPRADAHPTTTDAPGGANTGPTDPGAETALVPDSPPPPPPAGTTIAGRVLVDGRPLSDAYVYLQRGDDLVERLEATDATGRFHFTQAGDLVVGAAHAQHRPTRQAITAPRGEITEVELELGKSEEVRLRVVDLATRAPVAGAEVMILRSGEKGASHNAAIEAMLEAEGGFPTLLRRYSVFDNLGDMFQLFKGETRLHIAPLRTDDRGRVTVSGLIDTRILAVVDHADYPAQLVDADGGNGEIEVKLMRGTSLTVIAPRFDGEMAVNYVCEVDRVAVFPLPAGETRFDRHGRAVFPSLRPGRYSIVVSPEGTWQLGVTTKEVVDDEGNRKIERSAQMTRNLGNSSIKQEVTIEEGKDALVDLSHVGGAKITGRITPFAFKPPGWLAILRGGLEFADEVATAGVDQEGTFGFDKVAPGKYRIEAFEVQGGGARVEQEIEVRPGVTEMPVTLTVPQGEVTGLVTGADGKPLAGATVFALPADRSGPEANRELRKLGDVILMMTSRAVTGADGRYRLRNVSAAKHYVYCAKDGALARERFTLDEGEKRTVDLHLGRSHRITLSLEVDGKPQPGYVVVRGGIGGYLVAMALGSDYLSHDTGPRDLFILYLPPGMYHLDVLSEGAAQQRGHVLEVKGDESFTLRLERGVTTRLELVTAKGPLRNTEIEIRDSKGLTVPKGVQPLELIMATDPWRTDNDGVLTLPHVAPGRYTVHVNGKKAGQFNVHQRPATYRIPLTRE